MSIKSLIFKLLLFDFSLVLDDKALSLTKTNLIHSISEKKSLGVSMYRRVLIHNLNHSIPRTEHLLQDINDHGFNDEDLMIGLCEKEREMKFPEPRMFAVLTNTARRFIVETEHLVAKNILPLCPEITMVDSDLKLQTKKQKICKLMKNNTFFLLVYIMLDIESWCISMRKIISNTAFRTIDELHDFSNLFQRSHDIFTNSTKHLINGQYSVYDPIKKVWNKLSTFKRFFGGFEKLKQKPWTVLTVNIINCALRAMNIKYYILGQGDNQNLVLMHRDVNGNIPPSEWARIKDQTSLHYS